MSSAPSPPSTERTYLYLPTGDMSSTLVYQMAKIAADDGRPMRLFYFADCDPSGWNMPVAVGRKLQGLQSLDSPTGRLKHDGHGGARSVTLGDLDFQVHRVALTPEQVREHGLPDSPLKDTEWRADKWEAAMGVKQTEIDALAALNPDLLCQIARDAIRPFYDITLRSRVWDAADEWEAEAQAVVGAGLDDEQMAAIRATAEETLAELREEIEAINAALRVDARDFNLPEIVVPEPELSGEYPLPLLDSRWSFAEQTRALIDSKEYRP